MHDRAQRKGVSVEIDNTDAEGRLVLCDALALAGESKPDLLLVDAKAPADATLPGGNGLAFDWRLLAGRRMLKPWMLAGGLTPANVAEAVRLTGAPMVLVPEWLLGVFIDDPAAIALGHLPLQLIGLMMALDGLGIILMQALLGVGASQLVMVVSTVFQWGLFLPVVWWLGPVSGLGLTAIWVAMGVYRLGQAGVFVWAWQRRRWVSIRL